MSNRFLLLLGSAFFLGACANNALPDRIPPSLGSSSAPILIEEFADLQCPACGVISPQVVQVVRANPSLARLNFYHFPLAQHENAFIAAEASECAADQDKFWEFTELVFSNQKSLSKDFLTTIATQLSLDATAFSGCMDNRTKKATVLSDLAVGKQKGVNATPTLYVNGKQVSFTTKDSFERYLKSLTASSN